MTFPAQWRGALALCGALLLGAPGAQANLLLNGSFEATGPTLNAGGYCYAGITNPGLACGAVPGWTGVFALMQSDNAPWGHPSQLSGWTPMLGSQQIAIQTGNGAGAQQRAKQVVGLDAGDYELSWWDAGRAGFDSASYQVVFNGLVMGSFNTGGAGWASHSISFSLVDDGQLSISFLGLRGTGPLGDGASFVDGVQLLAMPVLGASAVPEPNAALLALAALAAMAGVSFHRRQRLARVMPQP